MNRTAFIFPGQGAQYAGMAKEFYDTNEESRRIFEKASEAAGFSIEEICFTDNRKIDETKYTQPALLTASCAILKAVEAAGIRADMTAGLSLGEYCALTAAGAIDFADAVKVVCRRGCFMAEEVPHGLGGMTAILSRKEIPIEEICRETEGIVTVANYNCPGQQVISGEKKAVDAAAARLLDAGAARAVPLRVDGPFHSPMLQGAGTKLRALLEGINIREPLIPYISNVTAQAEQAPLRMKELLGQQVYSPVRWQQSMEYMIREGADIFVEIGPGKTLTNFAKKIDRSLRVFHIERPEDLDQLVTAFEETAGQGLETPDRTGGVICCREKLHW